MSKPAVLPSDAPLVSTFAAILPIAPEAPAGRTKGARTGLELMREHARRQGHEEGFAAGREEGLVEGREAGFAAAHEEGSVQQADHLEQFVGELQTLEASIQQAAQDWFASAEAELESLVTAIARKVFLTELKQGRESVLKIVQAALTEVTLSRSARIRINPLDMPALQTAKADLIAACASIRSIEFVDDPSILGGCIIETDGGSVDATVEGAIDRLEEAA